MWLYEIFVEEPLGVSADCNGEQTLVQGFVNVSGTKVVDGCLTGNPDLPVVPDNVAPAIVQLEAQLTDLQSLFELREIPGHENGNYLRQSDPSHHHG